MTLGANCSALLPLWRSDYQPINRDPNCLGSDAGNYLYTLMERIFQKGTPTPLSSYILCTLPCSSFYYTCPKEKRRREKKNCIHFFTVLFSVLFILSLGLPLLGIEGICLRRCLRCPRPQAPVWAWAIDARPSTMSFDESRYWKGDPFAFWGWGSDPSYVKIAFIICTRQIMSLL